jgi:hypothetical protein
MIPKYVFVRDSFHGESETQVFSVEEPTVADYDSAEYGMVSIIRLSDLRYYGVDKKWHAIARGVQVTPDPAETDGRPFHAPAK